MAKYKVTSFAESSCEVEFEFNNDELMLVKNVLSKLNDKGKENGYCASFLIEDENENIILDY